MFKISFLLVREVQEEPNEEELPPVVIYKQAPRVPTPPPLVIREKPPTPVEQNEPIIIERRVPAPKPEQSRRVIVEEIPAPPAKPRDIILEKWLPRDKSAKRPVVVEKLKPQQQQRQQAPPPPTISAPPVYDYVEPSKPVIYQPHGYKNYSNYDPKYAYHYGGQIPATYDVVNDKSKPAKRIVRQVVRPAPRYYDYYNDKYRNPEIPPMNYYAQPQYAQPQYQLPPQYQYPNNSQNAPTYDKSRVAGYRIIRQIIPGPNATSSDIQKAIIRSQRLGEQANQKNFDNNNSNNDNEYLKAVTKSSSSKPINVDKMFVGHKSSARKALKNNFSDNSD